MPSPTSLQIFKRIVLRNKLLVPQELKALLTRDSDPEHAIKLLVADGKWTKSTAEQVLDLYRKKVDETLIADLEGPDAPSQPEQPALETTREPEPTDAAVKPPAEPASAKRTNVIDATPIAVGDGGVELMRALLRRARDAGASDLHVKSTVTPAIRVAGSLHDLPCEALSPAACEKALLSILTDEQRAVFVEHHDLDFCYDAGEPLGRFRTSYMNQYHGFDAVLRPIPSQVPSMADLKLPPQVAKFMDFPVGIVLVTGPKGCGKTTTLAAMVDLINSTRRVHIITIEDPVEFVHPCKEAHVNQRQVGRDTRSFSNALRSALREAPDVIMVGEMRDLETTSLAVTAAETGHLVLATLHTPDALRTIGRILDVFPPKEQPQIRAMISESLRAVVSQLLVPSTDGQSMKLAVEILINTPAIGHLIREDRVFQIPGLMQTGKKLGMTTMDMSLAQLAWDGHITKDTAMARADNLKQMEKMLE